MSTTQSDIRNWLKRAAEAGATHLIVATDTFDYDDYPVYVMPDESVKEKVAKYHGPNMQKVMEVYSLQRDWESQLGEYRAWHED